MPYWRTIVGAVLTTVGVWSLYEAIWNELCRMDEGCWAFLPSPASALPNAAIGTAILAGGIILLLSGWRRSRMERRQAPR